MTERRTFLKGCFALGIAESLGWSASAASEPSPGETYPGWRPGEMDLHFIYTGCGENIFYRLPDGTAILNDTGEMYRPKHVGSVPLLPSSDRLGGEWVARYLKRIYSERTIDYAIFTHWHHDHIGHARFDGSYDSDHEHFRFRTLPDGRKVNGFFCVAEEFGIRRLFNHQYPDVGTYGSQDTSMEALLPWIETERRKGLIIEPFRVGALDQIRLQRDPDAYRGVFSVRNVLANGKVWDGASGIIDYAADHVRATGKNKIGQNALSLGVLFQYGKFRYFCAGDANGKFTRPDGSVVSYEEEFGRRVGRVTVCKMNHHGCPNEMPDGFLDAVRADAYTCCVWTPSEANPAVLARIGKSAKKFGIRPLVLPNLVLRPEADHGAANGYELPGRGAAHVVIKVLPGGNAYRAYLLDATDEKMRVLAKFDRTVEDTGFRHA